MKTKLANSKTEGRKPACCTLLRSAYGYSAHTFHHRGAGYTKFRGGNKNSFIVHTGLHKKGRKNPALYPHQANLTTP